MDANLRRAHPAHAARELMWRVDLPAVAGELLRLAALVVMAVLGILILLPGVLDLATQAAR